MHIVISGSGQGIGKAIALDLSLDKNIKKLTLISKSNNLEDVHSEIKNINKLIEVDTIIADISIKDDLKEINNKLISQDIQGLINCAGILGPSNYMEHLSISDFEKVLSVNLFGMMELIKIVLPIFKKNHFGRIINFGGGGAAYGYPKFLPYALSKVSVVRFSETLAEELIIQGYSNIHINTIAPGAVNTQMLDEVIESGGIVKTTVDVSEPVKLAKFLIFENDNNINGRFIHSRDNYQDKKLFKNNDNLKLRRID